MSYCMWLSNAKNVEEYLSRNTNFRSINDQLMIGDDVFDLPVQITVKGAEKYKLNLDELDYFVSGCKNFEDLVHKILKDPVYQGRKPDPNARLIVVSNRNIINKYQPIYNNPFLHRCSEIMIEKRRQQSPEYLDMDDELKEYVGKILKYLTSPSTQQSLLDYDKISPKVNAVLKTYKAHYDNKKYNELQKDKDLLTLYCCNYKTLRSFVLWETKVLEQRNQKRQETRKQNDEAREDYRINLRNRYQEADRVPTEEEERLEELRHQDGSFDMDEVYAMYDLDDLHASGLGMLGQDEGKVKGKHR